MTSPTPDTTGAAGGSAPAPNPPAVTPVDTSGAAGGTGGAGTSTAVTGTIDTTRQGVPNANPAYRAPGKDAAGSVQDTTRTDTPLSNGTTPVSQSNFMTGTLETGRIGAVADTSAGAMPVAPGTPTVAAGPRSVTVSWSAVANPSGAPVLGYIIEGDSGGRAFAPANATSFVVTNLVPGRAYKFRVAARNKNGNGPLSAASAAATPRNPDAADKNNPVGIDVANRTNPVYLPSGAIKPGTGGTPSAPGTPTATAGAGQATVAWTAPTFGAPITGYTVKASTGQSVNVGNVLTTPVTGLGTGTNVRFTVTATNAKGTGETSAQSNQVTTT